MQNSNNEKKKFALKKTKSTENALKCVDTTKHKIKSKNIYWNLEHSIKKEI